MSGGDKLEKGKAQSLQVQIDDPVAQGVYSNFAMIYHSENEFVLDFAYIQPGPTPPRAKVRARVILSPRHMRKLLAAIEANVAKYESRFGPIEVLKTDDPPVFH